SERAANLLYIEKVVSETPGICSTILRCAGLAGYNREPGKFLAGRTNLPDPEGPVNLIHRDDCVQLTEQIITKGKWGETYNICADEHPSKREFYTSRSLKVGLVPPTFLDGAKYNGKIISNNKVKKDLDYLFKYPDPMEMP
ncbi:MAG: SDR family NAD(P)-dependent oxidoreductase, partial [Nitrospinota bacterium]